MTGRLSLAYWYERKHESCGLFVLFLTNNVMWSSRCKWRGDFGSHLDMLKEISIKSDCYLRSKVTVNFVPRHRIGIFLGDGSYNSSRNLTNRCSTYHRRRFKGTCSRNTSRHRHCAISGLSTIRFLATVPENCLKARFWIHSPVFGTILKSIKKVYGNCISFVLFGAGKR